MHHPYNTQRPESPADSPRHPASNRSSTPQMLQYGHPRSMSPSQYPNYAPQYSGQEQSMPYPNYPQAGSSSGVPRQSSGSHHPSHSRHASDAVYSPAPYAPEPGPAPQFFQTPAQTIQYQYANPTTHSRQRVGSISSPLNPGYQPSSSATSQLVPGASPPPSFPTSQHYPSQQGLNASLPTSDGGASPPQGDRYVCQQCGASFSRSHDRKRHWASQHLASPPLHRCRNCNKEFSRADSLKRHIDHGCAPVEGTI